MASTVIPKWSVGGRINFYTTTHRIFAALDLCSVSVQYFLHWLPHAADVCAVLLFFLFCRMFAVF